MFAVLHIILIIGCLMATLPCNRSSWLFSRSWRICSCYRPFDRRAHNAVSAYFLWMLYHVRRPDFIRTCLQMKDTSPGRFRHHRWPSSGRRFCLPPSGMCWILQSALPLRGFWFRETIYSLLWKGSNLTFRLHLVCPSLPFAVLLHFFHLSEFFPACYLFIQVLQSDSWFPHIGSLYPLLYILFWISLLRLSA